MKFFTIPLCILSLALLSGCVNRDKADATLAKGCAAGAGIYLPDGTEIKELKSHRAKPDLTGAGDRMVEITVHEGDGWYDADKTYSCIFNESFGFLNTTHSAEIVQLNKDGQIYGKIDGADMDAYNEWVQLGNAVSNAMK